MTDRVQGRCWACSVSGPENRQRNFLCGQCAHPQEVRSYCAGCGRRQSYTPAGLAKFLAAYNIGLPIGPGTVMRLECCYHCHSDSKGQRIEFYSIAA